MRLKFLLVIAVAALFASMASAQNDWARIGRYAQANSEVNFTPQGPEIKPILRQSD